MDDFVLNVKQIGQYPEITPAPDDVVLFQQGGIGGAYASTTTFELVQGALSGSEGLVGNGYISEPAFVVRDLATGNQGAISFNNAAFFFDAPIVVPTDPTQPMELTTRHWVQSNTVWSFNGRIGIVRLNATDINTVLGGTAATQDWTNQFICQSLQQFYSYSPLVFSFNGRVGNICLTLDDINNANFSVPGSYPQAPNPALGDASNNIATTLFVDETIQDAVDTVNNSWSAADLAILDMLQTQYAPINSPAFTGNPTAPQPAVSSSDATIATTAWVMSKLSESVAGVVSFNGRSGTVAFEAADVTGVGGALLNSPTFTGTPAAPTPAPSDNSTKLATTAFVAAALTNVGVTEFNGRTGAIILTLGDITGAGGAPINNTALTGVPTAPTAAPGTATTQLATTQFVTQNAVASFNGRTGTVSLQLNDITAAGGAPLASPTFTGTPAVPTAAPGTNTTQAASTAYVQAAIGSMTAGVTSFNTRTGAITLTSGDITAAGGVLAPVATSVNGRTGAVVLNTADITAAGGAVLEQVIPNCGRLQIAAGTSPSNTIYYVPYNGQQIKIAGKIYTFASSMQSVTSNSYVNGVPGQTLAAANTYYVYAFWNPGGSSVLMDFSMTGYVLDTTAGNEGVAVKNNDNTRTLIGIVRMTAAGLFADVPSNRLVRSWFNRLSVNLYNASAINHQVTTLNTNISLINGNYSWVQFADENLSILWSGQVSASGGAAATAYCSVMIDGTLVGVTPSTYLPVAGATGCAPNLFSWNAGEGYHTLQGIANVLVATVTYTGWIAGTLTAS